MVTVSIDLKTSLRFIPTKEQKLLEILLLEAQFIVEESDAQLRNEGSTSLGDKPQAFPCSNYAEIRNIKLKFNFVSGLILFTMPSFTTGRLLPRAACCNCLILWPFCWGIDMNFGLIETICRL